MLISLKAYTVWGSSQTVETTEWSPVAGRNFLSTFISCHRILSLCIGYIGNNIPCPSAFWSISHNFRDIELKSCICCQPMKHQI